MIRASDFLHEAHVLAKTVNSGEARRRSVISRAYYAAFHHILAKANGIGYQFNRNAGQGRHAHLIRYLLTCSNADLRTAAEHLSAIKLLRQCADYNLAAEVVTGDAHEAIESATYVLSELLPDSPQ